MANERILVVDDEESVRTLFTRILSAKGYEVVTADNGRVAVEKVAKEGPFDIIFLDIVMPEMGGLETFEVLRKVISATTVIIITGHPNREEIAQILKLGAYTCLYKPFEVNEVFRVIEETLGKR